MVNPNIPAMDHRRYMIVGQQITIAPPEITPMIRYNINIYITFLNISLNHFLINRLEIKDSGNYVTPTVKNHSKRSQCL